MNAWDTMRDALAEARSVMAAADDFANGAARICVGRLRKVDWSTLKAMKRELRDFNIHTGEWKDK